MTKRGSLAILTVMVAAMTASLAPPAGAGQAGPEAKLLWRIDKPDNSCAEFALAPKGYADFARDGLFVVGQSKPSESWPYCHPGSADTWGGGKPRQVCIEVRSGKAVPGQVKVTQNPARERRPVDYVNCLIGTSTSRWMLYPGASMPFGMVKLSPDNQRRRWKAGYEYTIDNIAGFSHLHSWTMGGLLVMPTVGELKIQPGGEHDPNAGYRSRFRHATEVAVPGYYAVTLDDYHIRSELTCTTRCGFQCHTFPKSDQARILFDLETPTEYGYKLLDAKVRKVSPTEIEGYAKEHSAGFNDFTLHFVARFSKPTRSMGGWVDGDIQRDVSKIAGKGDVGVFVNFRTREGEKVLVRTGISLVSIAQARLNLETEMKPFGWDFDACRATAAKTWNDLLGKIEVRGPNEIDKVKFYTNLYRAYCARTIWSDVNGKYVDMYEKVRQLKDPNSPVYGCDAFWNTFWDLNQLWVLVTPDIAGKWVRSLLEINDRGGWLAKGPTGIEYSSIMVASHEIALIVAAWQAGIHNFDAEKAYAACRHMQIEQGKPHPGGGHVGNRRLTTYLEHKYVPQGQGPTSNTMEYAYDDWCVAQFARALGKTDDYKMFLGRSRYWRNIFDAKLGFIRPRNPDGSWVQPFDPYRTRGFVEGNAWQYTWFVPQDVAGLIDAMGRDRFVQRLNEGMAKSGRTNFNAPSDRMASVPINHGNQPTMQVAYLFNFARAPWLTQKWSRAILDNYYGHTPIDGWPGDEDQGQGGAWFAMSAMGLFQVDGGCRVRPIYEITSPLFDRVAVHLDGRYYKGKTFVVEAQNNSKDNVYIQSATFNGKPLNRCWLYASEVTGGGKLVLKMGPRPNKAWGGGAKDCLPRAD